MRRNGGPSADALKSGWPLSQEPSAAKGHRGRDAAGLAAFVMFLAALWTATFLWVERPWGEYRPATGDLREPLSPPDFLIPALSLEEARQIVEQAGTVNRSAHDQP